MAAARPRRDQGMNPAELAERAVSLRMLTGRRHDAARVLHRLLGALDAGYRELRARGGAGLRAGWRRRSVTLGARVRTPDGREGVAEDVDEAGALIVRAEDGSVRRVTAGEIAMLLVVDVGNTNTKVGVYEGARLRRVVAAHDPARADRRRVRRLHRDAAAHARHRAPGTPRSRSPTWCRPCSRRSSGCATRYFGVAPFSVRAGRERRPSRSTSTSRREVGAGPRRATRWRPLALYGPPLIVVDFGTATNFDCVNARGEFIGGAIAPGLGHAVDALSHRAARLSRVELVGPRTAIGTQHRTNIQSGVVFGYAGLVDGIVERMRAELGGDGEGGRHRGARRADARAGALHPGRQPGPAPGGPAADLGARAEERLSGYAIDTGGGPRILHP